MQRAQIKNFGENSLKEMQKNRLQENINHNAFSVRAYLGFRWNGESMKKNEEYGFSKIFQHSCPRQSTWEKSFPAANVGERNVKGYKIEEITSKRH